MYVELPEVGKTFTKGDPFGVVESVKVRYSIVQLSTRSHDIAVARISL